jgi:hypothetical protein
MNNPFVFENQIKKWMAQNDRNRMVNEKITEGYMIEIKKEITREMIQVENERRGMMARGKRNGMEMIVQGSYKAKN